MGCSEWCYSAPAEIFLCDGAMGLPTVPRGDVERQLFKQRENGWHPGTDHLSVLGLVLGVDEQASLSVHQLADSWLEGKKGSSSAVLNYE